MPQDHPLRAGPLYGSPYHTSDSDVKEGRKGNNCECVMSVVHVFCRCGDVERRKPSTEPVDGPCQTVDDVSSHALHLGPETTEKEKDKDKGKALEGDLNGQANGTRRSGRNTGQQPELGITDPVRLERRLKRQRSNEATTDSHASEEESGENRDAKRSRMIGVDEEHEHDPLNIVSPMPVIQPRVHFAPEIDPMAQPDGFTPNVHGTDMVVDAPPELGRRSGGFDPSLLNPMSPDVEKNPFYVQPSTSFVDPRVPSPLAPVLPADPSNPFLSSVPLPAPALVPSPPRTPSTRRSRTRTKSPEPLQQRPTSPIPMVIERTPTPLPDFHVDDTLVFELRRRLSDETASLTIEELEQLRATCLGCVWRHRTEWDRDVLVKELLDVVKEFITEVGFSQ